MLFPPEIFAYEIKRQTFLEAPRRRRGASKNHDFFTKVSSSGFKKTKV